MLLRPLRHLCVLYAVLRAIAADQRIIVYRFSRPLSTIFAAVHAEFYFFRGRNRLRTERGALFADFVQADARIVAADAENIAVQLELQDMRVRFFAAEPDLPSEIFYLAPPRRERFAVKLDVAFPRRPVRIEIGDGKDLALFALGEFFEDGGARLSGEALAVEAHALFPHGERGHAAAVREVEVNFSPRNIRLAVN